MIGASNHVQINHSLHYSLETQLKETWCFVQQQLKTCRCPVTKPIHSKFPPPNQTLYFSCGLPKPYGVVVCRIYKLLPSILTGQKLCPGIIGETCENVSTETDRN